LVLADLHHLHVDVELLPDAAEEDELGQEPGDRRRRTGWYVDVPRRAGHVVLHGAAAELELEIRVQRLAALLKAQERVADVLRLRPSDAERPDTHDHAGDTRIFASVANQQQQIEQRHRVLAHQTRQAVARNVFAVIALEIEQDPAALGDATPPPPGAGR